MISRKLSGLVQLFRPELPAAAGICVLAGQALAARGLPLLSIALPGFLCGFFLSAAALILNDYFDYEIDLVNHPGRPLPSGAVNRRDVLALTAVVTLAGLGAAALLGLPALAIGLAFWVIGVLYNWRGKQTGLPGNLMVAASVGVTFVLGGVTAGQPWSKVVWTFAAIAFLIDLGEEIAGDAMDMEGDQKGGVRSIALQRGKPFALRVSAWLWALVLILNLVPVLMKWLPPFYLASAVPTDALILYFLNKLLRSQTPEEGRKAMRGVYLFAMLGVAAGVAAIVLWG